MNPKIAAMIQQAKDRVAARQLILSSTSTIKDQLSLDYNKEQMQAIELGIQGKNFCLIGAAGTGKTTVTQELIRLLERASHVRPLESGTKYLVANTPSIVICGFTNKSVNNIKKKLPYHLQPHCLTMHKLLEYRPVFYDIINKETGELARTMRFAPNRNEANPLPHISTLIIEESGSVSSELFSELLVALPRRGVTQFIFLGDLNQLPPVFGPSILGFKLTELTTIELTHVYRQALESPIIKLATDIRLNQNHLQLKATTTIDNASHGNLTIHPWKKRVSKEAALQMMTSFLPRIIEAKEYNPEEDMILCPFNKSFGTVELNNIIADYLGKQRNATVFEVIARYKKTYWAEGDQVMVDRHDAVITKITRSISYIGKLPVPESATLDRWGFDPNNKNTMITADPMEELDRLANEDEEAKNLASHLVTVYIPDLDIERTLNTAGEINSMTFGYCLTVHKAQGSEWNTVFLLLHDSHAIMLSRELIYTAVTRAKHKLYIVCEGDNGKVNSLTRAAQRPMIPGLSLQEKIAFFQSKVTSLNGTME